MHKKISPIFIIFLLCAILFIGTAQKVFAVEIGGNTLDNVKGAEFQLLSGQAGALPELPAYFLELVQGKGIKLSPTNSVGTANVPPYNFALFGLRGIGNLLDGWLRFNDTAGSEKFQWSVNGTTWNEFGGSITGGDCPAGQFAVSISTTGVPACAAEGDASATNEIQDVIANRGLERDATSNNFGLIASCTLNQILKWNGTGWSCAADSDSDVWTTITGGINYPGGTNKVGINDAALSDSEALLQVGGSASVANDLGVLGNGVFGGSVTTGGLNATGGNIVAQSSFSSNWKYEPGNFIAGHSAPRCNTVGTGGKLNCDVSSSSPDCGGQVYDIGTDPGTAPATCYDWYVTAGGQDEQRAYNRISSATTGGWVSGATGYSDAISIGGDSSGNDLEVKINAPTTRNQVTFTNQTTGTKADISAKKGFFESLFIAGAGADGQILTYDAASGNAVWRNPGSGADNWGTQVVQRDASLKGNGTTISPLGVDMSKVAALDTAGKVLGTQLPALAITDVRVGPLSEVYTAAERMTLGIETGDVNIDGTKSYIWDGTVWQELKAPNSVTSVNGQTGAVTVAGSKWSDATGGINYAGGNVGIGDDSPDRKLDVLGIVRSGWVGGPSGDTCNAGILELWDEGDNRGWHVTNRQPGCNNGNDDLMFFSSTGVTAGGGTAWAGPHLTISNSGNVGIGTAGPGAKLDVNGAIMGGAFNIGVASNADFLFKNLKNTGKMAIAWNRSAGGGEIDLISSRDGGHTGGFSFYDLANDGTLSPALMTITGSGNVGWANSALSADQGGSIELGNAGTPYIDFKNDTAIDFDMRLRLVGDDSLAIEGGNVGIGGDAGGKLSVTVPANSRGIESLTATAGNTHLPWSDNWNYISGNGVIFRDSSNQEKMRIDATTGNVGIGTAGPKRNLDVMYNNSDGITFGRDGTSDNSATIQTYIDGHWDDRNSYAPWCGSGGCNGLKIQPDGGYTSIGGDVSIVANGSGGMAGLGNLTVNNALLVRGGIGAALNAANAPQFTVTPDGKVGIGTSVPATALSVRDGDITIQNRFRSPEEGATVYVYKGYAAGHVTAATLINDDGSTATVNGARFDGDTSALQEHNTTTTYPSGGAGIGTVRFDWYQEESGAVNKSAIWRVEQISAQDPTPARGVVFNDLNAPTNFWSLKNINGSFKFLNGLSNSQLSLSQSGDLSIAGGINATGGNLTVQNVIIKGDLTLEGELKGFHGMQEFFTGSGSWTVPHGVSFVHVLLVGGGGGGGAGNRLGGGGGGGGGGVTMLVLPVTLGDSIDVVVGSGGNGGSESKSATSGGNTSVTIGKQFFAYGGGGGGGGGTLSGGRGGLGIVSGGSGGPGGGNESSAKGATGASTVFASGGLGTAEWDGGGGGGSWGIGANGNSSAGANTGGGGGGGQENNITWQNGGAGGSGYVRITY